MTTRVSKRPPSRRKAKHSVEYTDSNRVPVPTLEARPDCFASYTISPFGRVYRDDGRLLTPRTDNSIRLNGGKIQRSIPALVFRAFGDPELVDRWESGDLQDFVPWVPRTGATDPAHGRLRCSIHDVKLVPHAELINYGRRGVYPSTQIPIV